MSLWPQLSLPPDETLLSYADRLSMLHTGCGMRRIIRDIGINIEQFTAGREEAVLAFAQASSLPPADAQRAALRVFPRGARFRGEAVSKNFLSMRAARYCPACLAEASNPADWRYHLLWGFRHVSRCDLHGTWLEAAPIRGEFSLRFAIGADTPLKPREARNEMPSYLKWLKRRLEGRGCGRNPWEGNQTLEQVLAPSEMIGAILQHGHKVALNSLSPQEREEATDIGFSIYSEGPEAVTEALDTIRKNSPAAAVQAGPLAHYGKLFDWLDRRSNAVDPGPIRDILRDHIVKHSAVEPGAYVLGVEITERRFHTLHSLSGAVGIEQPRLTRLLKRLGEIPEGASGVESGKFVFEVDRTLALIDAFKTAIRLHDVADYLNASQRQVECLYRAGVVRPLVPRGSRGAVRNVVFGRSHLDDLLLRMAGLPILDPKKNEGYHPISYACQRGAGRFEDLFPAILNREVPGFRDPGKKGIAAIVVHVQSLMKTRKPA